MSKAVLTRTAKEGVAKAAGAEAKIMSAIGELRAAVGIYEDLHRKFGARIPRGAIAMEADIKDVVKYMSRDLDKLAEVMEKGAKHQKWRTEQFQKTVKLALKEK